MKWLKKRYIRFRILLLKYRSCIQKIERVGDIEKVKYREETFNGEVPIFLDEFKVIDNINAIWEKLEATREKKVTILFTIRGRLFFYYVFTKSKRHLEDDDFFMLVYFMRYLWLLLSVNKRKNRVMSAILNYYVYCAKKKNDCNEFEVRDDYDE